MEETIMRYLETARARYAEIYNTAERYRNPTDFERAEANLVQIECLCMDLKLITETTI